MDFKAVLFDLDGTLVDTAPDFIRIIRVLCQEDHLTPPSDTAIRQMVSEGANAMCRLIKPELADDVQALQAYRTRFLSMYESEIAVDSCLFEGFDALLSTLAKVNIPWGVVTNKPRYLSTKLLDALNVSKQCAVLVCSDDVKQTKPHPEPMFMAASILGVDASSCIYVGDHPRDIEAGQAAGMKTVVAEYGYLPPYELKDVSYWGADGVVKSVTHLQDLLTQWIEPLRFA